MSGYRIVQKSVLRDHLRHELRDLLAEDIVVTSRGRPVAVVMSLSRWNVLQEKVERLEAAVALMELGREAHDVPALREEPGPIGRR